MRSNLLLVLLVLACSRCVRAEEQEEEGEAVQRKEKTEEIEEQNNVMLLNVNNFARALRETKFLLVEFYAPWCGHCRSLEPEYVRAAETLRNESSEVRLAKVDASEERDLSQEFSVESFPTLILFTRGDRNQTTAFSGSRNAKSIVQWLKRRTGPGATLLQSVESTENFLSTQDVVVVGFFPDLNNDDAKAFNDVVMDMVDTTFGITQSLDVFNKFHVSKPSVVLFKKFDEQRSDFEIPEAKKLDKEDLKTFIQTNSLERVVVFSEENAEKIFTSKIRMHFLLFINTTVETHALIRETFHTVSSEFKGKVLFILIDVTAETSHVLNYFGLKKEDAPTLRLINVDTVKKYAMETDSFTDDNIRTFCQAVLDGTVQPHMMSQQIPEDWDQKPLKVLVGRNFAQVAFDLDKNVFVEFYAPWCEHCKELAPVWENLAEKYKDHENILIAHMDATANEVESLSISGFPTIRYFPAGPERKSVDYVGKRDVETFSIFLDNGGVLPKEPAEDEDTESDDDHDEDDDTEGDDKDEDNEKVKEEALREDVDQDNGTSRDEL